jgi:hypothetical protein
MSQTGDEEVTAAVAYLGDRTWTLELHVPVYQHHTQRLP